MTAKINREANRYNAFTLDESRHEKSEMWRAIFSIMFRRISLFQIHSGFWNSPRNTSAYFSAPYSWEAKVQINQCQHPLFDNLKVENVCFRQHRAQDGAGGQLRLAERGAECLLQMRVLQETGDGQNVGAVVHENEEENAGQIEARHRGVVLKFDFKKYL
jgi:hypothetical protein